MTASPCVSICRLDPRTRHCIGCGRSIDEIAAWPELSDAQRLAIKAELPARIAAQQAMRTATHKP
jgi:predicted Fe-S protein YdhL (DUF1289 family)